MYPEQQPAVVNARHHLRFVTFRGSLHAGFSFSPPSEVHTTSYHLLHIEVYSYRGLSFLEMHTTFYHLLHIEVYFIQGFIILGNAHHLLPFTSIGIFHIGVYYIPAVRDRFTQNTDVPVVIFGAELEVNHHYRYLCVCVCVLNILYYVYIQKHMYI